MNLASALPPENHRPTTPWLNRTVLGIGLASLFSDWSHEIATTLMPAFLATMGVAAAWLGLIEGVSDGLSSFAKMASGYYTDRLRRRKPIAVLGYVITAFGTASFGLATQAWHVLASRATAWLGRGVRTPVRKALLAGAVTPESYGRAFGFERMMDTLGAIVGPATALWLLGLFGHHYPSLFAATLVPGLLAAALITFVEETLEDSFCAELVCEEHHGIAFGLLATVNGVGDFLSSLLVGVLWSAFGVAVAFTYSAMLSTAGAVLVWRTKREG